MRKVLKEAFHMANIVENSKPPFRLLTGRYLAHNRLSHVGRAFLAADLYAGIAEPTALTLTQAAKLARVNYTAAWWASHQSAQRADIVNGLLPLVPARSRTNGHTNGHTISDPDLETVIHTAGVERVLDIAARVEAAEHLISAERFLEQEIQERLAH
jgi:hypothetical protein